MSTEIGWGKGRVLGGGGGWRCYYEKGVRVRVEGVELESGGRDFRRYRIEEIEPSRYKQMTETDIAVKDMEYNIRGIERVREKAVRQE